MLKVFRKFIWGNIASEWWRQDLISHLISMKIENIMLGIVQFIET